MTKTGSVMSWNSFSRRSSAQIKGIHGAAFSRQLARRPAILAAVRIDAVTDDAQPSGRTAITDPAYVVFAAACPRQGSRLMWHKDLFIEMPVALLVSSAP
nr:hypothetical protein [Massilia sp. Leaf139]